MRSRIYVAMSGDNDAMMYSNMVCWLVIPRAANCASNCANQMFGSDSQNGRSLTATTVTHD